MSANIKIGATIQLHGANNFKKATTEMGAAVTKFHKAIALTPRQMRDTAEETTLLRKQLDSFKSTVQKTDPALAKVRQELANNLRALRSHGVDVRKVDDTYKKFTTTQNTVIKNSGRMGSALKSAGAMMGGAYAATMVLAQPVKEQMAWDRRISFIADVASPRATGDERLDLKKRLNNAVDLAGKEGGTRDDIAAAMDELLKSGTLDIEEIIDFIPWLNKAAVSTGASAKDLAALPKAFNEFGLRGVDAWKEAINGLMTGGQFGGFELNNFSRYAPTVLAKAKAAGMYGQDDFFQVIGLSQAAVLNAGTVDEAANNLINMFDKLGSKETRERMAKVFDQDLEELYLDAIARGMDPVTALTGFVQQQAERDPRYKKLQNQLKNAKSKEEHQAALGGMTDLLFKFDENGAVKSQSLIMGGVLGELISDRQAGLGFSAAMNRPYVANVVQKAYEGRYDAVDFTHANKRQETWWKAEVAKNEIGAAKENLYQNMDGALGDLIGKLNTYAAIYPGLTTSLVGVWEVAKGIGAAGLAYGFINKVAPISTTVATSASTAAATAGATGRFASALNKVPILNKIPVMGSMFAKYNLPMTVLNASQFANLGDEEVIERKSAEEQANYQQMVLNAGGEDKLREIYQRNKSWYHPPFSIANHSFLQQAIDAEKQAVQSFTPTAQQLSQPTLLDLQSNPALLDNFLKSPRNPISQQPQDMQSATPQVQDNSQRSINLTLQVTDERQIIPIIQREMERYLNQEKLARRAALFDDLEAIS